MIATVLTYIISTPIVLVLALLLILGGSALATILFSTDDGADEY